MTRYIILPLIIVFAAMLSACQDDLRFQPIGEGEANIQATIKFHPLIAAPVGDQESRTPGDAIKTIRDIQVVIYKPDKNVEDGYKLFRVDRYGEKYDNTFTKGTQEEMPDDYSPNDKSEESTETATFTIKDLPYGRYKIYAVANYETLIEENIQTPVALMNHKATWHGETQEQVSTNDQMFGCFSADNNSDYDVNDNGAPVLEISKNEINLTAWIKRLASKITIVYDGQQLFEGINIYIKSVSVRDIPKECVLGFNKGQLTENYQRENGVNGNSPTSTDGLLETTPTGSLYYRTDYHSGNPSEIDSITTLDTDPGVNYTEWMQITRNVKALGAVSEDGKHHYVTDENGEIVTHTESMPALYFYENCQGNYPDNPDFDKTPDLKDVGIKQTDEKVFKDRVPYGTFIEVEGYYVSTNPNNQSSGPIKYRFMLGQNNTYNYNALRNRHYKITLKFKGYANQPEWHIVYDETEPGLYPYPEYNVSYMYNVRHDIPIRLTGNPYKVTLQIIENNWAPYDPSQPDSVAPAYVATDDPNRPFRWYKASYDQQDIPFKTQQGQNMTNTQITNLGAGGRADFSPKPVTNYWISGYYYGKHKRSAYNSKMPYVPAIPGSDDEITPIWVGFLALQVPKDYDSYSTILTTGIQDTQGVDNYYEDNTIAGMRNYYNGNGGTDIDGRTNIGVKLYECSYEFNTNDVRNGGDSTQVTSYVGGNLNGRNAAKLKNNGDDSYTLTVPFFTMPKDIGYITGFSGNNPYEAYERRAKVLITAYFKDGEKNVVLRKRVPVFQQKRIVNPKGVWRAGTSEETFHVRLMELPSPASTRFQQIESDGEWEAWVATEKDDYTHNPASFIFLTGGTSEKNGRVFGSTGSLVDFTINFRGTTEGSRCAKVMVRYHNKICEHAIFVRQGYNEPLAIAQNGARWSSYCVFAFNSEPLKNATSNLPGADLNLLAEMTVNPLALGTMFKRGNYGQGIRIINNKTYPVMVPLTISEYDDGYAPLGLISIDSDGNHVEPDGSSDNPKRPANSWPNILGIQTFNDNCKTWSWSTFHSNIVTSEKDFNYEVPTYDDFQALAAQDFGFGVLYANGAPETQEKLDDAYGYFNDGNTHEMESNPNGMRGVIIYNKDTFNQIFFPIGYSGVGRRTVQITPNTASNGYLRYGATYYPLSTGANWLNNGSNNYHNALRPVSYNLPANPGAQYWIKTIPEGTTYAAFDVNYFDFNFSAYDASTGNSPAAAANLNYGDALPIKPVVKN